MFSFKSEKRMKDYINYTHHVTQDIIATKDGDLIKTYRVEGLTFVSESLESLNTRKDSLNMLLRSIGQSNNVSLWLHTIRRKTSDELNANYKNDFCQHLNNKYYESFKDYPMMLIEHYFTIIYRPNPTSLQKTKNSGIEKTISDLEYIQNKNIDTLYGLCSQFESQLADYNLEPLVMYNEGETEIGEDIVYSEYFTFLNYLLTFNWQKIRYTEIPINEYLCDSALLAGTETLEIRSPRDSKYVQSIDFKDYNKTTYPGILNALYAENFEFVMTQSFSFMAKPDGEKFLKGQQKKMKSTEDGSVSQMVQLSQALDDLISGEFVLGEYHFNLSLCGETVRDVKEIRARAMTVIQEAGFLASQITLALQASYFAQLPAHWAFRPRIAWLTSRNFASLGCMHNFALGKRDNNPWGQAVTLLKTPSGQPHYFNFHSAAKDTDDNFGKENLGNTLIIGQSGSGKTAFMCFLLAQLQKYNVEGTKFTTIYFDKDRAAKNTILACDGKYLELMNGEPTGLNPFQLEDTSDNLGFLNELMIMLAGGNTGSDPKVSALDEQKISQAIIGVYQLPKPLRNFSLFYQNMTQASDDEKNSLKIRYKKWLRGETLGWVFDNNTDSINFDLYDNYGIDGTDFLDNVTVRSPLTYYLLYRLRQAIDGRRFVFFMDECWKWLDDEVVSEFAKNMLLTIRKLNGLGVFATQSPDHLLKTPISSSLIAQCVTQVYLANNKAEHSDYVDGFKLSPEEYNIIRNLGLYSRTFLIKQGHRSAIANISLRGFDDELAVLSGSAINGAIMDQILAEIIAEGKIPSANEWMPVFQERRKIELERKRSM